MSQGTVPTEDEHAPIERPLVKTPRLVHDPRAQYAAREEVLRQQGYDRDEVRSMGTEEVFTRLAQAEALKELEQQKGRDQAFFERHRRQAQQSQGNGLTEVPGMEEASHWLG